MINGRWVNSTWGSSSLLMLLQLSTPDDQWGWGGVGVLLIAHHFNSQLLMTNGDGWAGVLLLIAHDTSTLSSC